MLVLQELQERWRARYKYSAKEFANRWVNRLSDEERQRFEANLAHALGIDYTSVFDDASVQSALEMGAMEASELIKSIPENYFQGVRDATIAYYKRQAQPEGRTFHEQLMHLSGVSKSKATLIARDQTSKIHTSVAKARNEMVGITHYIWRTALDNRVVGKPGGLYPDSNRVHGNHYAREGKKFAWDKPPADGHPGHAINCRCYAEPIIDMDKLKLS